MSGHRPRRILYLIESAGPAGAEGSLVQLVTHLHRDQYDPVVGVIRDGWLRRTLAEHGIDAHLVRGVGAQFDVPLIANLARMIRRERVALVHAYMFAMGVHGAVAAFLARVPVVYSVRGRGYELASKRRRYVCGLLGRWGCHFTAVSRDIAGSLSRECGIPAERITFVPNGVDTIGYAPRSEAAAARALLGLRVDQFTLGTVGRLEPVKGLEYLLHALPSVESRLGPIQVAMAGNGSLRDSLGRLAAGLDVSSRVVFVGQRDDVPRVLAALDVFALPSLSEGMSNALLQAMAASVPCIATAVGGNAELLRHGETGLLVPAADSRALADAVVSLATSTRLRETLATRARHEVEQHYTLEQMVLRNEGIYARLLGSRGRVGNDVQCSWGVPTEAAGEPALLAGPGDSVDGEA